MIELTMLPFEAHLQKIVAMRWFNRRKPKEPWDEVVDLPIDDFEAARRIRHICNSALGSAEKVGGRVGGSEFETERFKRAAKAAMEIAIKISDDLLRDAALRQIVALCMKANELRTATILCRAIQAESVKDDVLNEYPALR
jgi:hypothetical protein